MISDLKSAAVQLVQAGIRQSTKRTYLSVQKQFLEFCNVYSLCPVPASEVTLLLYITHLNGKGMAHASVLVQLAGIRNLHVEQGYGEPIVACPQIKQALRAIKEQAPATKKKSPIKLPLLIEMWDLLKGTSHELLWKAVLSLAFFGGLRGSEYSATQANSSGAPLLNSIHFMRITGSVVMQYKVPQSKTQAKGMLITYGCSLHTVCPVCAVKDYFNLRYSLSRVSLQEPLFLYKNRPVSKNDVDAVIKSLIKSMGLPPEEYSAHSLRAGVASSAAEAGFKDWEVQELGGWQSKVYQSYIRDIRLHRAQFAKRLIKHAIKTHHEHTQS